MKSIIVNRASRPLPHGQRVVNLLDSRIAKGACGKGFSSSFKINRIFRCAAPHAISGCISLTNLYIVSEDNLSDDLIRYAQMCRPAEDGAWIRKMEDWSGQFCPEADSAPVINEGMACAELGITVSELPGLEKIISQVADDNAWKPQLLEAMRLKEASTTGTSSCAGAGALVCFFCFLN